jgi:DNA-binding transcriptional regulator YhcF (GntR family)
MKTAEQEAREIVNHVGVNEGYTAMEKDGKFVSRYHAEEMIGAITSALTRKERVIETLREALQDCKNMADHNYELEDVARTALAKAKEMEGE